MLLWYKEMFPFVRECVLGATEHFLDTKERFLSAREYIYWSKMAIYVGSRVHFLDGWELFLGAREPFYISARVRP